MEQFAASVNKFLTFNDYQILPDKGCVSAAEAKTKAESEYDIFNKTQKIDSDFDKEVRRIKGKEYRKRGNPRRDASNNLMRGGARGGILPNSV